MKKILYILTTLLSIANVIFAQEEIKLYPNGAKESNEISVAESYSSPGFLINISNPRMFNFFAPKEKANGTAVLICPGGSYYGVAFEHEGVAIAKWFNELGVSAFVLYYRMPNGHTTIPLRDAQTALTIIQKHAKEWNIDKNKIGIMGFSAGGHLASTVGTHFKSKSQRPAFMILGYPVVSMKKEVTHAFSRKNLIGENPTPELESLYSNELQVTKNTPPTFIVHANDDKVVPVQNSILLYKALLAKKVVAEMDTFAVGGHGFGMIKHGIPVDNWSELLKKWLKTNKFIK